MALKYLVDLDLGGNELQSAALQALGAAPQPLSVGHVFFNTATEEVWISNDGVGWEVVGKTYTADNSTLELNTLEFSIKDLGVTADKIAANAVTATKLNGVGNGTAGQYLSSDGSGGFNWGTPTDNDVNTTNLNTRLSEIDPIIGTGSGTVTVNGNLAVSGTTTTLDTVQLVVTDNIVTLNAGATAPSLNAGIEVNRGSGEFVPTVRWNELSDTWEFSNDGSTYSSIGSIFEVVAGAGLSGGGTTGTITLTNGYISLNVDASGHAGGAFVVDLAARGVIFDFDAPLHISVYELVGNIKTLALTEASLDISTGQCTLQMPAGDWLISITGIRA